MQIVILDNKLEKIEEIICTRSIGKFNSIPMYNKISKERIIAKEGDCLVGDTIKKYHFDKENIIRKSDEELFKENLLELKEDEVFDIEIKKIREKNLKEKIESGIVKLEKNQKYDEKLNNIRIKTELEMFVDGELSKEDIIMSLKNKNNIYYKILYSETDINFLKREKRKSLGIWSDIDEEKYKKSMISYTNLIEEHDNIEQEINKLTSKQKIVNFFEEKYNKLWN